MKFFSSVGDFRRATQSIVKDGKLESVFAIDFVFFDKQPKFTLISVPTYNHEIKQAILVLTKNEIYYYGPSNPLIDKKTYGETLDQPYGKSTVATVLILRSILKDCAQEFSRIRELMNRLDLSLVLEDIESCGRDLRRLTDRCEELVKLIITLKEREIKEFDPALFSFDYELLNTEARYWLERCRSHVYRIASLRTKYEMRSNKELNDTMKRLTVIVTFLTIISIVVSVPGTIGAIFGIPALSEAYFNGHATVLVLTLSMLTLMSILLGFVYWKSLGLK